MLHSHNPDSQPGTASSARELITAHGGRVTRTRVALIETLQGSSHPLSHDEIGAALAAIDIAHDRVTLYRALDWLVEQGIAQRVASGERAWRFEIARQGNHRHAHFHCDRCGQVLCLEDIPAEVSPSLPAGFEFDRAEVVLHGACADCGRRGSKGVQP
jgi:Fur family transcriptional regulator, ferric uptake regulator